MSQFIQKESTALTKDYTKIPNQLLNANLPAQAILIYINIQKHITIPNFKLGKAFLMKQCEMAESTFEKYWGMLQHAGYLKTYQIPDVEVKGHFATVFDLLWEADTTTPYYTQVNLKGDVVKALYCKGHEQVQKEGVLAKTANQVKQLIANTLLKGTKKEEPETVAKPETDPKSTVPPIYGGTVIPRDGNLGVLNNTNTNKTYSNKTKKDLNNTKDLSQSCQSVLNTQTDTRTDKPSDFELGEMVATNLHIQDACYTEEMDEQAKVIHNSIVDLFITDVFKTKERTYKKRDIQGILAKLTHEHIKYILYKLQSYRPDISQGRYIKAMLLNAYTDFMHVQPLLF